MLHKKELILSIIGIIMIVVGAYITANLIHTESIETLKKEEVIKVGDQVINFKLYRVDKSFFIKIPETFIKLDAETLKAIYSSNDRPELVFKNGENNAHVFITTTDIDVTDSNLNTYIENYKNTLTTFIIQDYQNYQSDQKPFVKLSGIDTPGNLYKDIRYFSLDDKLAIIEFNTLPENALLWQEVSSVILDSICFREEEIKKE